MTAGGLLAGKASAAVAASTTAAAPMPNASKSFGLQIY